MPAYNPTFAPHVFGGDVVFPTTVLAADGPIGARGGYVHITKGSAAAITLAAPTAADEGKELVIISETAFAHVITSGVRGFNGKGSSGTATFGAVPFLDTIRNTNVPSKPRPTTEAEWEDVVRRAGADVCRAWLAYLGAVQRALTAAQTAQAAGITGAARLLPSAAGFVDVQSPALAASVREAVERGFITEEQAKQLLRGNG